MSEVPLQGIVNGGFNCTLLGGVDWKKLFGVWGFGLWVKVMR